MRYDIINSIYKSLNIRHIYVPRGTYIFEYQEYNTYLYSWKKQGKNVQTK